MPRLILIRHAKAALAGEAENDFHRSLTPRGRADAGLVGGMLLASGLAPERVLCSAALRTRETLAGLLPALSDDCQIHLLRDLYDARSDDYLAAIAEFGGEADPLLVIGHNPAIHEAAIRLIGEPYPPAAAIIGERFPTAALAVIDFEGRGWRRMARKTGRLAYFTMPRDLSPAAGSLADD